MKTNHFERLKTDITQRLKDHKKLHNNLLLAGSPGLYHYLCATNEGHSRVHIRIDPDGNGLLLVNANRVMFLNQTAAIIARLLLEQIPEKAAIHYLTKRYQINTSRARNDFSQICEKIQDFIRPNGPCPLHEMDIEIEAPFSARPSAPYRMDLALTYRCNNDCDHCYNARPRNYPEMETNHWKVVIDRLWELGIPHIVFTGGEPTLRSDLPELIKYAEEKGQITGLNTNGRRLSDKDYIDKLVEAGLDHVQITLESHHPEIHNQMVARMGAWDQTVSGIRNALNSPLYVMTNTTMLLKNSPFIEGTLEFLATLGVPTVGLNALIYAGKGKTVGTGLSEEALKPILTTASRLTGQNKQKLIWYTPTQYCHFDPMELNLGVKGCTAALYNMCIEPDGEVIPCQSFYYSLGNLLYTPWDSIWNHDVAIGLRERHFVQEKCFDCPLLSECGGGCPLILDGFDQFLEGKLELFHTIPERIGDKL